MIAELQGKIGVDTTDLDRADAATRQFATNIESAFRRTGGIRAGAALEGFIENLTSGNVVGAIESIAARLTGLGLVGNIAFATLGIGLVAVRRYATEMDQAIKNSYATLALAPEAGASIDQIKEHVELAWKSLDDLEKKTTPVRQGAAAMWEALKAPAETIETGGRVSIMSAAATAIFRTVLASKDALTKQSHDYTDTLMAEAKAEEAAVRSKIADSEATTEVSETIKAQMAAEQAIAAIHKEREQALNRLTESGIQGAEKAREIGRIYDQAARRETAAGRGDEQARIDIERRAQMKDIELAKEIDINAVKSRALSPEAEKAAIAQASISALQRQLAITSTLNTTERERLEIAQETIRIQEAADRKRAAIDRFKPLLEKSQLGMEELLGQPGLRQGGTIAIANAQRIAREAAREEAAGQQERLRGNEAGAFERFFRAEQLKSQIPILKESEKMPEFAFRAAIDGAGVFKDMVTYLAQINAAMSAGGNPFANK